jgi:hypothetical protein
LDSATRPRLPTLGVQALLAVPDHSGTVLLAYETARKAALGLLLASGWRPTGGEREHRITFEAAGHLLTATAARTLDDAAYLRRQRNDKHVPPGTRRRRRRGSPGALDPAGRPRRLRARAAAAARDAWSSRRSALASSRTGPGRS